MAVLFSRSNCYTVFIVSPFHFMILTSYIHQFITSLFFTVLLETLVLFLLVKFVFKHHKIETWRLLFAGFFASFSTIPYVWFIFPFLLDWSRSVSLMYSEPFAFIVEAIFYRVFLKTSWKVSLTISLVANAASYFGGPLLRSFGIWLYW